MFLWSGKVLEDESQMDQETKALHLFNKQLREDDRFQALLLPIRDWTYCCYEKNNIFIPEDSLVFDLRSLDAFFLVTFDNR